MPLDTSIECVLFDLDGTLIDTAPDFVKVIDRLRAENDMPAMDPRVIYQTVSDGARALVTQAFNIAESDSNFEPLRQRLLDLYGEQLLATEAVLYPALDELLGELEGAGIPWGIVTNKPEQYSRLLLEKLQLLDRCGALICPEHVEHRKPHPEPILLACETLRCNTERAVYVGDHARDVQAAKSADVIAIAVSYGYLAEGDSPEDWYADFIIREPQQIAGLLNTLKFS